MAKIKCRYVVPYCGRSNERLHHDEYWWCDSNDHCEIGEYTKPSSSDVVNPTCVWCKDVYGEFENTFDEYEYLDGDLHISFEQYPIPDYADNEIIYLEIDGRVLKGGNDG